MTIVVDKRNIKSSKNASNRSRFVERYKRQLKKSLQDVMKQRSITDAGKPVDVPVDWSVNEEDFGFDRDTGYSDAVISGNKEFIKGDLIEKENSDEGSGGTKGGAGNDNFNFTLTKEEFFDIYFEDMELPDFVKESMLNTTKMIYQRAGFIKDGIPARIDVLKTMQQSIARRISCDKESKKPPFLDDIDLRYKHYVNVPKPMLKAVIFCCMDVSGSMEEHHKTLSKKFFIFLYLFLTKNYDAVEVRFIRYHHRAIDCTEHEFFYSHETGGTEVMEGLKLIKDIIDKEYPPNVYNIYIAHTSDGDMGYDDQNMLVPFIDNELIPLVQYYAYLQVQDSRQYSYFEKGYEKMYGYLKESVHIDKKLNIETAVADEDIFPVLHNLFKKR